MSLGHNAKNDGPRSGTAWYGPCRPGRGPAEVASGADLERLLAAVDALRVCRGGPSKKVYSGAEPELAYLDSLDVWRHVRCPLVLTEPGELCRLCRSLEAAVMVNMKSNHRKQQADLMRTRIPKAAINEDILMLRKKKNALQKSNMRLEERIGSVHKKLADLRPEIRLVEEEMHRQRTEYLCSKDCMEAVEEYVLSPEILWHNTAAL
ncbi:hypothetical protein HPB50_027356 [Hyalomma asiaticum]|uniref:Uncharacterized protein n=1 Tax=Hyalomma asiaticum TaxID=266040 RepID=A0ACB7TCE1_HYAAI|nr:hypothetical protein HPB50_027356 [Hyalomma asiaticum]